MKFNKWLINGLIIIGHLLDTSFTIQLDGLNAFNFLLNNLFMD